MARNLDSSMSAALSAGLIIPVLLCQLTFRSATRYIWTGVGNLVWDAQTYSGVGSLGKIGAIQEGVDVQADGTQVTLSGIDPTLLGECLTDIQVGAPAIFYFGLMANATTLIGSPYKLFAGTVDVPTVSPGADTISISLTLESRMVDLSRPTLRRYTSADQRIQYPDDIGFAWVEQLNDIALNWGG